MLKVGRLNISNFNHIKYLFVLKKFIVVKLYQNSETYFQSKLHTKIYLNIILNLTLHINTHIIFYFIDTYFSFSSSFPLFHIQNFVMKFKYSNGQNGRTILSLSLSITTYVSRYPL